MSNRDPEPVCFICGILARYVKLFKHGIVFLCQPCEDTTDEILVATPPGTPYSDDLRTEDAAQEARG